MRADWVSMSRADCVCIPAFDSFGRAFIAMFRTTTGIPRSLSPWRARAHRMAATYARTMAHALTQLGHQSTQASLCARVAVSR